MYMYVYKISHCTQALKFSMIQREREGGREGGREREREIKCLSCQSGDPMLVVIHHGSRRNSISIFGQKLTMALAMASQTSTS